MTQIYAYIYTHMSPLESCPIKRLCTVRIAGSLSCRKELLVSILFVRASLHTCQKWQRFPGLRLNNKRCLETNTNLLVCCWFHFKYQPKGLLGQGRDHPITSKQKLNRKVRGPKKTWNLTGGVLEDKFPVEGTISLSGFHAPWWESKWATILFSPLGLPRASFWLSARCASASARLQVLAQADSSGERSG